MVSDKMCIQNLQVAFVCVILGFNYSSFGQDINDKCEASDGIDGYCIDVGSCDKAVRSIRENRTHYFKRCGFENSREIICCPFDAIVSTPLPGGDKDLEGLSKSPELDPFKSDKKNNTVPPIQPDKFKRPLRISEQACEMYEKNSTAYLRTFIIGGSTAEENEFPHMAAIKFNHPNLKTVCGGSLISKRHILTVAHCLMDVEGNSPVAVQLGSLNDSDISNKEVTTYLIENYIIHPLYSKRTKHNDIGIIKLTRDVIMMNSRNYIYPACLNTDGDYASPGDHLTITGWGLTDQDKASDILKKATVAVISIENCAKVFNNNRGIHLTSGQICAAGNGTDTCSGDSGGPLQSRQLPNTTRESPLYRIIGLTSFGYACGTDRPGVYTRISHYIDWIESIAWPDKIL